MFKNSISYYFSKSNAVNISILLGLFLITEAIINPIGDFPLNDDWVYGKAVLDLYNNHTFNSELWGRASMIAHVFYAKLFISCFGYSYTTLRFSTLLLSSIGIVVFYIMNVEHFKISKSKAFFASLLLLYNPIYLNLSNSFMTDVPFLCTAIFGFYFYFHYRNHTNYWCLLFSVLFFIWCVLIRQLGISFVLGIFVTDIVVSKKIKTTNLLFGLLSLTPFFVFEYWFKTKIDSGNYPSFFFSKASQIEAISQFAINFSKRWIHYVTFTGLVLSPILIPYLYNSIRKRDLLKSKTSFIISILLFTPVFWSFKKFPIGNYIYNVGLGSINLYDTYILQINRIQNQSPILFYLLIILSIIGSFSLIYILVTKTLHAKRTISINADQFVVISILISLFFYYTFLALNSAIFDRYIFIVSVLLIPVLIKYCMLDKHTIIFVLFLIMALYSTLATKDFLRHNSLKWVAVHFLHKNYQVSDTDINAGYEHAGLTGAKHHFIKWQNTPKHQYIISAGNIVDYHKFTWFTYQRYIPFKMDTIFVLQKNEK